MNRRAFLDKMRGDNVNFANAVLTKPKACQIVFGLMNQAAYWAVSPRTVVLVLQYDEHAGKHHDRQQKHA